MNAPQQKSSPWLFRLVAFFTAIQVVWFLALVLDFVTHPWVAEFTFQSPLFRLLTAVLIAPPCIGVSLLVLRRAPGNVVGLFLLQWAILMMGQTMRVDSPLINYSAVNVGWVGLWLLFLYFPTGRAFPHRFERVVNGLTTALLLSIYLWVFVFPTMPEWFMDGTVTNLFFITALEPFQQLGATLESVTLLAVIFLIPPSIALRYLRSPFVIRQQMKWVAWVGVLVVASSFVVGALGINTKSTLLLTSFELFILFVWSMFITLMPFIGVGNAILRHRLYDIDIIIRRTLIYSVLTGILAIVYFGAIILTQQLFRAATGETPDIAIVISTLLIAALFSPIRRRVQDTIDRRLYRRKYDVEQTLANFQKNLREDVDMETLKANLVGVVSETMQPTRISLWVKK